MSARVEGVEPSLKVLETSVLPLNYTRKIKILNSKIQIPNNIKIQIS